jgi:kynurenine formamidase
MAVSMGLSRKIAWVWTQSTFKPNDGKPLLVGQKYRNSLAPCRDNARYGKSCPGIGVQAAEWRAKQDPMLVGSDNWPVEVLPNPDPQVSAPVHQILLVVNGIYLLENLKLEERAAKRVHEFAFIIQPLKMQGFSGSTVAPIAVR